MLSYRGEHQTTIRCFGGSAKVLSVMEKAFKGKKVDYGQHETYHVSATSEKAYPASAAMRMAQIPGRVEESKILQ